MLWIAASLRAQFHLRDKFPLFGQSRTIHKTASDNIAHLSVSVFAHVIHITCLCFVASAHARYRAPAPPGNLRSCLSKIPHRRYHMVRFVNIRAVIHSPIRPDGGSVDPYYPCRGTRSSALLRILRCVTAGSHIVPPPSARKIFDRSSSAYQ